MAPGGWSDQSDDGGYRDGHDGKRVVAEGRQLFGAGAVPVLVACGSPQSAGDVPAAAVMLRSAEDGQQQLVCLHARLPGGLGFSGAVTRGVEEGAGQVDAGPIGVDGTPGGPAGPSTGPGPPTCSGSTSPPDRISQQGLPPFDLLLPASESQYGDRVDTIRTRNLMLSGCGEP